MSILCIHHGNCADGFGSAWAVRKFFKERGENVEFFAGIYGAPPPDVAGRTVIMTDFSYKRPVIDQMAAAADSLLILDHHKTAAEDLAGLPIARGTWDAHVGYLGAPACPPVGVLFDMNRSGAGLTWDFFFPDRVRPTMIDHIEDRDLWRFKMPGTRELAATIFSHPYDFSVWDWLVDDCDFHESRERLIAEGAAIERKHFKDIDELLAVTQRRMVIGGHDVPVANLPYIFSSDAGHKMAQGEKFAACYSDTPDGRTFSLRSAADGLDVSEIAKTYGGGGHAKAAGFRVPIGWEGDR
jgi:oligoribonuclease NrnB/cAMP/cGMP phosphodiesterase (DHH superfamily)